MYYRVKIAVMRLTAVLIGVEHVQEHELIQTIHCNIADSSTVFRHIVGGMFLIAYVNRQNELR